MDEVIIETNEIDEINERKTQGTVLLTPRLTGINRPRVTNVFEPWTENEVDYGYAY